MRYTVKSAFPAALALAATLAGCEKGESYSDLLRTEEKADNWYLAGHTVENEIPADGRFLTGDDAPYYRMDDEGAVYMQVVSPGDSGNRPEEGDKVFFRFERWNIKYMYEGIEQRPAGNQNNLDMYVSTSLIYGNTLYQSTTQFGQGIQVPLEYLGYYSEVNLVIKSTWGFTSEQGECTPYLFNVKYYPAEY